MKEERGVKIILFFLIFCITILHAQKEDYQWLSGYSMGPIGYDTSWGFYFGTTLMNFNSNPVVVTFDSTYKMNFDETNTSFCDSNGNLLFYTNGIYIANSLNETIENGDSLNAGWAQYIYDPTIQQLGYRIPQGIYAIAAPGTTNKYILIHSLDDSIGPIPLINGRELLNTLLDMSANGGLGQVIYKNQVVIDDLISDEFAMVRHGNGRDWWALVQKRTTNCYYRVLIDGNGVHKLADSTCGGTTLPVGDYGIACFSPDGSKYVYMSDHGGLNIFDFDRCSGELSNPINLALPIILDSGWVGKGVAISPNNRFLYVSLTYQLYQFDLSASNIIGSIDTVGFYDGYEAPDGSLFNTAQSGPDGKIYISCGNAETDYHVINNPDSEGFLCDFQQHSIHLPSPSGGVPSFPNYRLGALSGSVCDTLTGLSEVVRAAKEVILKVYPNPTSDIVTVDYGYTDWSITGVVTLEISNELGQIVYKEELPLYSGYQKLDVTKFAAGIYTAFIKRNEQAVAVEKFAKE